MNIQNLSGNPGNPRTITDKKLKLLKNSLEKFGDLGGFVFNKTSQMLVGGHQRAKIFDKKAEVVWETEYETPTRTGTVAEGYVVLNGERFKYREVAWDEATEKAANIAANKGAGEWDAGKLTEWFSDLNNINFDLDLTMFDETERIKFLKEPVNEGLCDEDEVPEVVEPKTKPGDLYKLGNHRVLCGDSTNVQHVERLMSGEKADFLYCDPPYGMNLNTNYGDMGKNWISDMTGQQPKKKNYKPIIGDAIDFDPSAILTIFGYCKEILFWGADYYYSNLPKEGSWIIWDKRRSDNFEVKEEGVDKIFGNHFEVCWSKQKHRREILRHYRVFGATEGNSGEQPSGKNNTPIHYHPTQKPVQLHEKFFERIKGEIVVDLFLGSGSTLIACHKTNRKCYGMEIDPHYCDVIIARWEKFTGLKAELLPDPHGNDTNA